MVDYIIRNARVVDATQDQIADVAIENGTIAQIAPNITGAAAQIIHADGLTLLPGGIDAHVHFNEPGRTDWEGLAAGSSALAKGGFTSFFDMPLNSTPPLTTPQAYAAKRQLADEKSVVNAYLWGGLTPHNLDQLAALAECGVIGYKAFISNSGIEDFAHSDDYTLYRGMEIIAKTGKILAVHAENDAITAGMTQAARRAGKTSARAYLDSRPIIAEVEAIQRVITLAKATGCKLHIVHVSSAAGIELVNNAKSAGLDITCETCPHYLCLLDTDVERIGALAKCAPPIRDADEQNRLWQSLLAERIDFIASDHSPSPMSMKQGDDFFAIWGGIASCQSTLSLLLTHGYHERGISLQRIAALTSAKVAQRFGLINKGFIKAGYDADLTLVNVDAAYTLQADALEYRHKISPYVGMALRGVVHKTWVGGEIIYGQTDDARP